MTSDRRREAPSPPARVPDRNRHLLTRIRRTTRRKQRNAVVDSTVDMQADIDAINRGDGIRDGSRWTIHGRTYAVDATGHSWPVEGAGIYPLDRGAFLALAIYNEFGETATAERILDLEGIAAAARAEARRVWQIGRETS